MRGETYLRAMLARAAAVAAAVVFLSAPALTQTATSTIRGVLNEEGAALPGMTVTAVNKDTGFEHSAVSGADGSYAIAGLSPGTYEIRVSEAAYQEVSQTVRVLLGQALTVNIELSPKQMILESVTVIGSYMLETKTSEISTNVTPEQIENLPQNSRNFLNFAGLAPGIRISTNDLETNTFSSGAQLAERTNVFIDGVSFKNDVLLGGVVGQDASRGNPFPQNAVQEFRVLTQNFKAEYEKSSTSIITAVTKSGGNELAADAFFYWQSKDLVTQDEISKDRGYEKPDYSRWQGGVSIGGPIVKDKAHYFVSYEQNNQSRNNLVTLGGAAIPSELQSKFSSYPGVYDSPFRSKLFFSKLSYQPAPEQTLDVSVNVRHETEIRGFGGQTSYEAAEEFKVDVANILGRHQWVRGNWLNQASLDYQRFEWNPTPLNPEKVAQNYFGIMSIGGKDTEQDFIQSRVGLRDDLLYTLSWKGQHALKTGVVLNFMSYDISKRLFGTPVFNFRSDESYAFPFEAFYGVGNPDISAKNRQLGIYAQDDWSVNDRVTVNAGLRWDYESDMLNNDYVTPANVITALQDAGLGSLIDRYTTDGNQRPPFYGAWQPRLGVSYDLKGDARTVLFAGWGRYSDRTLYNDLLDEKYRLQYGVRQFRFSADGSGGTIAWRPEYLSIGGLDALIASGIAPDPELFLIDNDTKPPQSDQWTVGVRKVIGNYSVNVSYAGVRGKNGFTFFRGNLAADGSQIPVAKFSNVFISSNAPETWYDALFVTFDRPYTSSTKWGVSLTYTLARGEKTGGDLFSAFDYRTAADFFRYPTNDDERHRIVASGIFGLPYGFLVSTLVTLGSGTPYNIYDASAGWSNFKIYWNEGRPEGTLPYQSIDIRLNKDFMLGEGRKIGLVWEAFNIFDHKNYIWFDGFKPPLPEVNANFGKPGGAYNTRRLQFGLTFAY